MTTTKAHRVLDPRTLGRPVHLTDRFTAQIREALAEYFRIRFNRRYRAGFEVGSADLIHSTLTLPQRGLAFGNAHGCIGFAISREIVLRILRYRYGMPDTEALEPETASEERLVAMLGEQLVNIVAGHIESLHAPAAPAAQLKAIEMPGPLPASGGWTLRIAVAEPAKDVTGFLWFLLDEAWITRLLQGLTPARRTTRQPHGAGAQGHPPLSKRLSLTLSARLLEKELPFGTVLDLEVGDVIPVSLSRADVLVGDSRLFSASVAEHKGKLCLTTFEDME